MVICAFAMKQTLKLLAPYLAAGIFWCALSNGWLAILAYHAQILFWSRKSLFNMRMPAGGRILLLALPAAAAGPLIYLLLPHIARADLAPWLAARRLSGLSLAAMIPYFGLVHPFLEQAHWSRLRARTLLAHPAFAGYHMLVLYTLLTPPWLILCFVVLTAASAIWRRMETRHKSIAVPVASQVLADLGIVAAAWLKT